MKDWIYGIGLSILAVFAPIKTLMVAVGFLIVMDTIMGIWAAKRRKKKITSAKLRSTISKAVIYQFCIVSGFVLEKYIIDGAVPIAKIIAGAVGTVEIKSLLENANFILGGSVFNEIKNKLGSTNLRDEK